MVTIPDDKTDPYALAPLDLGQDCIRLVELQPNSDSNLVRCRLRSYTIQRNCPSFIALSYKWDHESPQDCIELNGVQFSVGHSLWTFLNRMRLDGHFDTFWIDALCINQLNILERNHQVQMMRADLQ